MQPPTAVRRDDDYIVPGEIDGVEIHGGVRRSLAEPECAIIDGDAGAVVGNVEVVVAGFCKAGRGTGRHETICGMAQIFHQQYPAVAVIAGRITDGFLDYVYGTDGIVDPGVNGVEIRIMTCDEDTA